MLALANDINVAQQIGFGIIAVTMVVAAIRVVTSNNVFHAALWLILVLAGAAAQYLLLAAEFVAVTQVLVYIGAVMVLFLFGAMLTRASIGGETGLNNKGFAVGIPVALLLLGTLSYVLIDTFGDDRLPTSFEKGGNLADPSGTGAITSLSDSIFKDYLLPFWALSFVLLAATIGAIVLARKD
jgi:NADH-quinone oxidoreductase subunit J